ncbi:MAG: N-acetyltransferase [Candidatus Aenigmatarchaeota archaeon]|mgnify:CR=1 FL=1|nr:MAG: N-acetyltransferase [Candidatus Aenigmarchaeota archaeon]
MPIRDVKLGKDAKVVYPGLVNMYECEVGDRCLIGPFVEIQKDVIIGNDCRVQSHSFICSKARIGNSVFIGHGVMFVNDKYPPRFDEKHWEEIIIEDGVTIGSNATILPVRIGENSLIGAGAVVTKDVPPNSIAVGNPAKARPRGS